MKDIGVFDFFSGCGGTSVGFRSAGFSIRGGLDNNPSAAATFRRNFPGTTFLERNVREVTVDDVAEIAGSGPTLFAGCAPCQPFSKQNRQKRVSDSRADLLWEFRRFVLALRPNYVVVENVPGLQKVGSNGPLPTFRADLVCAGYSVESAVLRAADYGVPQQRSRLVLVASRDGIARLPSPCKNPVKVQRTQRHGRVVGVDRVDGTSL